MKKKSVGNSVQFNAKLKPNAGAAASKRIAYRQQTKKLPQFDTKEDEQYSESEISSDHGNINKPKEQLQLAGKELEEDMPARMLSANNPQAPKNTTMYNQKDRKFQTDELVDQLVIHFSLDGDKVLKDSNEAQVNEAIRETREQMIKEARKQLTQEEEQQNQIAALQTELAEEDEKAIKKTLRNKFNYNDHEAETVNCYLRERGVSSLPPAQEDYRGEVTQWMIFDAYMADLKEQTKEKNQDEKQEKSLYSASFKRCLKIMERMVNQNEQQQKYEDYKYYWCDDEAIKTEGNLLPIWKFCNEKSKKKHVTSLCWNPRYNDMFAVGLGSYHFMRQRMGLICLYSLKNTTHPEYSFNTDAGVMALDFHPKSPALLAVGLYDGTVLVFDVRNKHKRAIYQSTIRIQKHIDPVWEVKWNPDISKKFNFYSVSSDGRIMNWILMKNKLEPEEVFKLKLTGKNTDEETTLIGNACGLCFDFNKFEPNIFLVGTEEGRIHKCSRSYSGQYQETYKGHLLAVYKVKWNCFHSRTFISASADWTVKLWDSKMQTPVMSFDLQMSVVDVVWAPYSSTGNIVCQIMIHQVFATATLEKILVYDLSIDKYSKIADIKPGRQSKLTNLAFNQRDPILVAGDEYGRITLLKLSPTLTKSKKLPPEVTDKTHDQYEMEKMENLLIVVGKFENENE